MNMDLLNNLNSMTYEDIAGTDVFEGYDDDNINYNDASHISENINQADTSADNKIISEEKEQPNVVQAETSDSILNSISVQKYNEGPVKEIKNEENNIKEHLERERQEKEAASLKNSNTERLSNTNQSAAIVNTKPKVSQENASPKESETLEGPTFVFDTEPEDEVVIDVQASVVTNNDSERNATIKKFKTRSISVFKKLSICAACFVVMIIIPLAFSMKHKASNYTEQISLFAEKSSELDENPSNQVYINKNATSFESAQTQAYDSFECTESKSTRFETLDDLTLYIDSNASYLLSEESQAYTKYKNDSMTINELRENINVWSTKCDELNHLLVANRNNYIAADQEDVYDSLAENINSLMVYGDSVLVSVK